MKGRILVIDDDDAVRATICENLIDFGYAVSDTNNGEDALQRIREGETPDLVITDIVMPHKEGLEIIMDIKKEFPAIKLIAISGGGSRKTTDFLYYAKRFGADEILPKPLDMDYLESIIARFIIHK